MSSPKGKEIYIVKKNKIVLRDTINGITDSALKRILHKSGVSRIKGDIYDALREKTKLFLDHLLNNAILSRDYFRRVSLKVKDVEIALELEGINFGIVMSDKSWTASRKGKVSSKKREGTKQKIKRKSKPGKAAKRTIKRLQKDENLLIPHLAFYRLVRECSSDYADNIKFTKDSINLLQSATETYLGKLIDVAYHYTLVSKRSGISIKDLELASRHTLKSLFCYYVPHMF